MCSLYLHLVYSLYLCTVCLAYSCPVCSVYLHSVYSCPVCSVSLHPVCSYIRSLFAVGCCACIVTACIVTALPLGLDQMPDASSTSITSYIAWLVYTIFIGLLVYRFPNLHLYLHLVYSVSSVFSVPASSVYSNI